jgi:hypothetical protein
VRSGLRALKNSFLTILDEREEEISPRMQSTLIGLYEDWLWLDERVVSHGWWKFEGGVISG